LQQAELVEPFSFAKGCPLLRIPARYGGKQHEFGTLLFDLESDPRQERPLQDSKAEERMQGLLRELMEECQAPQEQFERLGL
jgi:hypothetical protein